MTTTVRHLILRANALYIGLAGSAGVIFDIRGVLYGAGPQGRALANAPHAGIGFVEAHGLAVILAVLLWRARPERAAHITALAVVALLGTANLAFWQTFIVYGRPHHGLRDDGLALDVCCAQPRRRVRFEPGPGRAQAASAPSGEG
jgi:hypothetical protein